MSSIKQPLPSSKHGPGWPLLALLGLGIVGLAVAWFALTGPLNDSGKPSYRYVEAVVGTPSRVNPLFAHLDDADRDLAGLVFSGLTRLGADGQTLPDLAESWEVSPDAQTVTFHLRKDVSWDTGADFTAADVLFTYGLLADPKLQGNPDQAALWRQVSCSAPSNLTVLCKLPEPFSPFLAYTTVGILPKHALEGVAAEALFDNTFNQHPVGTGPYRLTQLDQSSAILRANQSYYLGAPLLPEINLRFYPDEPSAAAAVVRGEAHAILLDSSAKQDDFDALSSTRGLNAYAQTRSAYTVLYLNNSEAPFNDRSVRQAVSLAVDIDGIIGDIVGGRAERADSPIVSGTWAFNPEIEPHKRKLDDARNLLKAAGWEIPEDGKVRLRNGTELRVTLMTDRDELRGALAKAIANQIKEIGIAVTVVQDESSTLVRDFLIPRRYQAAVFGWEPGPDPDPYPAWHSSQATEAGRNLAAYASEKADMLMEEARRTSDLDERQRLYYTFQQLFHDDAPSVLLYHPVYTYFVTEQVKGLKAGILFNNSSRFRNVQEWTYEKSADIRNQ